MFLSREETSEIFSLSSGESCSKIITSRWSGITSRRAGSSILRRTPICDRLSVIDNRQREFHWGVIPVEAMSRLRIASKTRWWPRLIALMRTKPWIRFHGFHQMDSYGRIGPKDRLVSNDQATTRESTVSSLLTDFSPDDSPRRWTEDRLSTRLSITDGWSGEF